MKRRLAPLALPILGLLSLAPVLGSCGLYNRPSDDDREARRDCDAEADRIFAAQNRYQMSERTSTDTPYAGNTLPSNPTAGLSDQYAEDKLVDACLRHSGAGAAPGVAPGTTPSTGPSPNAAKP
jgi:hypothetical protein